MPITYIILLLIGAYIFGKWSFFVFCRRRHIPSSRLDSQFVEQLNGGERK